MRIISNLLRNQSGRQILMRSQQYAQEAPKNALPFGVRNRPFGVAAVDLRDQFPPSTRHPFEMCNRLFGSSATGDLKNQFPPSTRPLVEVRNLGSATGDVKKQRSASIQEIEEDPKEDEEDREEEDELTTGESFIEDIAEHMHNTLLGYFQSSGSMGLFGPMWERLQLSRFFSSYDRGNRILKLGLFARPGRKLSVHALYIQTERDKMYHPQFSSCEEYTKEAEIAMGGPLLKRLEEFWVNYEEHKTNFDFRKQMWEKHGKQSGLSLVDYFKLTMDLFDKINAIDFNVLGDKIEAMDISVEIKKRMEETYGFPGIWASPSIVCRPEKYLYEIRYPFRSEAPYLPFKFEENKKIFINCEAETPIIW